MCRYFISKNVLLHDIKRPNKFILYNQNIQSLVIFHVEKFCERLIFREIYKLESPLMSLFQNIKRFHGITYWRTNKELILLIINNKNISHLNLKLCKQVTMKVFRNIAEHLQDLRYLRIAYSQNLTDDNLKLITSHHPNIMHLNLSACGNVASVGFSYISI